MKRLFLAAALAASFLSPAQAATATWDDTIPQWIVTGDSVDRSCVTSTTYLDGTVLGFGVGKGGFNMFILDPLNDFALGEGVSFKARFIGSDTLFKFEGQMLPNNVAAFPDITPGMMLLMGDAAGFQIVGRKGFKLINSRKAIDSMVACWKALNNG